MEDRSTLASGKRFVFGDADYSEFHGQKYPGYFQPLLMEAKPAASLPSLHHYAARDNKDLYSSALLDHLDASDYPYDEVNDRTYGLGDLFINGYSDWGGPRPELQSAQLLGGEASDWIILLKVSSVGDMMWGDSGDLFFIIHKSDLSQRDFSKVQVTMNAS